MTAGVLTARDAFGSGALVGGRFRIEAALGQGATGAVHRVRDERTGRTLALKHLRDAEPDRVRAGVDHAAEGAAAPQRPRELSLASFEREYHALCELSHPCIIEVYDYGIERGTPYYTMEWLAGQDLSERGSMQWRETCRILIDIASSLAMLHSRRLLHRDLSARNVRTANDGHAKLIDFGAMMVMGVAKHVVGTPPFVAPEALQMQALDARADLYALGALAYWLLTGRHAYPARSFRQLHDAWRSAPRLPAQYVAEIPEELNRLVMQLLCLDRAGRPSRAGEVIERAAAIGGVPLWELPDAPRAYLSTPSLVGREAELQRVRASLVNAMHGRGASVLISGVPGSGRSRMLDACVLEAKLLGAVVLRVDAGDSSGGEYSLARALCEQLLRELPEEALRSADPWSAVLSHLLPQLAAESTLPAPTPERRHLQAALRNWIAYVARSKRLVIAVDDLDAVDEPSAALLGALAHASRRCKLTLLVTIASAAPASAALALLQEEALSIATEPLSEAQSLSLLRSIFGDAEGITYLAEPMHRLSQGKPRALMMLCEHWVERGVARYEAGSWSLPAKPTSQDLPASLAAALVTALAALPHDARAIVDALSLTDASSLPIESYVRLTDHADPARTYHAVAALVTGAVLIPAGDRYRFAQAECGELLRSALSADRKRELHRRIASIAEQTGNAILLANHLMQSGQEQLAIERLLAMADDSRGAHAALLPELIEAAISVEERQSLALRLRLELRHRLLIVSAATGQYARFMRYAGELLLVLERDSGLAAYCAQRDAGVEQPRIDDALARAQQHFDRSPLASRTFSPREAIVLLAKLCAAFVAMASIAQDRELLERLPSLEPLFPLGPALRVVQKLTDIQLDMQASRYQRARQQSLDLLEMLARPEHDGMDSGSAQNLRLGQLYLQGLLAAIGGQQTALEWVRELEQVPGHRANAWRVRMTHELLHGDPEAAANSRRRAELLTLQDGSTAFLPGTTARIELLVHIYASDLIGVKRSMEQIEGLAAQYPKWQPTLHVARSYYRRLQGDLPGALAALVPALETAAPGRHFDWGLCIVAQVGLLGGLGRGEEAIAIGMQALAICQAEGFDTTHTALLRVLSEVLCKSGRLQDASSFADRCIERQHAQDVRGLPLGLAYETRARVAIAMRDEASVRRFGELCTHEFRGDRNPALSTKYRQLLDAAYACGIRLTSSDRPPENPHDPSFAPTPLSGAARAASERLLKCVSPDQRALEGLKILIELTGAKTGYLFLVREEQCELLAARSDVEPAQALLETLDLRLRPEFASDDVTTLETAVMPARESEHWADSTGRRFEPLLLFGNRFGSVVVTGVAALHYPTSQRPTLQREVLDALAQTLLS